MYILFRVILFFFFILVFFQAEDGIRDLVRSRGLGDVYKRQIPRFTLLTSHATPRLRLISTAESERMRALIRFVCRPASIESMCQACLLYTSDAADERSSVDLGGRRIIKKKNNADIVECALNMIKPNGDCRQRQQSGDMTTNTEKEGVKNE